jgi:hypothetical protein
LGGGAAPLQAASSNGNDSDMTRGRRDGIDNSL